MRGFTQRRCAVWGFFEECRSCRQPARPHRNSAPAIEFARLLPADLLELDDDAATRRRPAMTSGCVRRWPSSWVAKFRPFPGLAKLPRDGWVYPFPKGGRGWRRLCDEESCLGCALLCSDPRWRWGRAADTGTTFTRTGATCATTGSTGETTGGIFTRTGATFGKTAATCATTFATEIMPMRGATGATFDRMRVISETTGVMCATTAGTFVPIPTGSENCAIRGSARAAACASCHRF